MPALPPPIIEYVQPNCPHVAELASLVQELRRHGVTITEINAVANKEALAEAKRAGVRGTPTITAGGRLYAGSDAVTFLHDLLARQE